MRQRFQIAVILFAWLLAAGGQWQLVQSFAWARMFVAYAKTMPLREAARLTFTPDNMCGVCELVSAAQKQNPERTALPAGAALDAKLVLIFQPSSPPRAFIAASVSRRSPGDDTAPPSDRPTPPVPPPRPATA